MKIVNIIGGLGNQMFQYAFALSLQKKTEDKVYIDISHFNHIFVKRIKSANLHNGFEIEKVFPNAHLEHAKWHQLIKITWYCPNYLLSRCVRRLLPKRKTEFIQPVNKYFEYIPQVYDLQGNIYYEGLWSAADYYEPIKDLLKQTFAHPDATGHNAEYIRKMNDTNSVGIHVRRGDYLFEPDFRDICEIDYYKRSIQEILSDGLRHTFFVFSNDMKWCKANLLPLFGNHEAVFVTENVGKNSCWDMHLMRHCKDLIIANSSFSWWAATLKEKDGRVIAPKTWVNRDAKFDIWNKDWIKL